MIDYTEILLTPSFSGQTDSGASALQFKFGYWVYASEFGGNLVDDLTVREFLDNPLHEKLATDFFNYLKDNFSSEEFQELYYNNIKLAAVLNDYYNRTVRANAAPTKTEGIRQLLSTTAVTFTENYFIGDDSLLINNSSYDIASIEDSSQGTGVLGGLNIEGLTSGLSTIGGITIGGSSELLRSINRNSSSDSVQTQKKPELTIGARSRREVTVLSSVNTGNGYYVSFAIYKNNNTIRESDSLEYKQDIVEGSLVKKTTEWFRYALRKDGVQINPNGNVAKIYSFNTFNPLTALQPNQSQLRIQFEFDRFILDTNNRVSAVDVNIVFDRPAPFTGQFFLVEFGYANVSAGIDFGLVEGNNNSLLNQSVNILLGQTGASVSVAVKNSGLYDMSNCEITLTLKDQGSVDKKLLPSQKYSVSKDTFRILSNQPNELPVLDNTAVDKIVITEKIVPNILLQSFVDPNYNDNESEIWQNPPTNLTLISTSNEFGSDVTLPLANLTTYFVYNSLIKLGYELSKRSGNGGTVVVMNGNTDKVRAKLNEVFPGFTGLVKRTAYSILGYNLLTIDLNNSFESNQIFGRLVEYWNPYNISN